MAEKKGTGGMVVFIPTFFEKVTRDSPYCAGEGHPALAAMRSAHWRAGKNARMHSAAPGFQ